MNASVSMYMGFGGTNFGHWSGANGGGGTSYQPHITSYDYDSPIAESGVHGYGSDNADKYTAVKTVRGLEKKKSSRLMLWTRSLASTCRHRTSPPRPSCPFPLCRHPKALC